MLIIGNELQEVSQVTERQISALFVNLHPKDVIMTNGIIEYDQAIAEIRGFSGAMFRAQDRLNYEHFYLRPHQPISLFQHGRYQQPLTRPRSKTLTNSMTVTRPG